MVKVELPCLDGTLRVNARMCGASLYVGLLGPLAIASWVLSALAVILAWIMRTIHSEQAQGYLTRGLRSRDDTSLDELLMQQEDDPKNRLDVGTGTVAALPTKLHGQSRENQI